MNSAVLFPQMPMLPVFTLDTLMTSDEIRQFSKIKIISRNDEQKKQSDKDLILLPPEEYLARYRHWLGSIRGFFSEAYTLCTNFQSASWGELNDFCTELNNMFKAQYGIPINLKRHVDLWTDVAKRKIWLCDEENYLLQTPETPSAPLLMYIHKSLAMAGKPDSRRYLQERVYLHTGFTEEELASPLSNAQAVKELMSHVEEQAHKKFYFKLERPLVKALDELLTLDNLDEAFLWKIGNHRLPLIKLYSLIEDRMAKEDLTYVVESQAITTDKLLHKLKQLANVGVSQ